MLNKRGKILVVIACLILTFLLVYLPHINYPYPLHADEYLHLSQTKSIVLEGYGLITLAKSPYMLYKFAYDLLLTPLYFMQNATGLSVLISSSFLPAIFAVFASLFLFLLVYKLTGKFWLGIFAMLFFASLPSNVNLRGLWFATPFELTIPLTYLFFIFFTKSLENYSKKTIIISTLIVFLIAFIHASSVLLLFPVLLIYFLINYKNIKKKPFYLMIFLPYALFLLIGIYLLLPYYINNTFNYILSKIIYSTEPILQPNLIDNPITYNFLGLKIIASQYFLPLLYGIIPFLLALFGIYYNLKESKLRIFLIWFLTMIFLIFIYSISGFSLLARRQYIIYYGLLALPIFSALGLEKFIEFLDNKLESIKKNSRKLFILALIILIFIAIFYNYGNQRQGTELYHLIDTNDYQALNFLKTQEPGLVLAPLNPAVAVYILSNKQVYAQFHPADEIKNAEVKSFYNSNCEEQLKFIQNKSIKYVYSNSEINCNFLKEIYSKNKYIYSIS